MHINLDSLVGLIAPHVCMGCGVEGSVLCSQCITDYFEHASPQCAGCRALVDDFSVCNSCKSWLPLRKIYFANTYSGVSERLIHELKFQHRRQASHAVSICMSQVPTLQAQGYILCPIPTSPERIRERGFDHCKLICKQLSTLLGTEGIKFLERSTNVRQVGSSRAERFRQMEMEFKLSQQRTVKGRKILLVDDVMTSGATVASAARILKKAGAKEVSAIVFARK